MKSAIIGLLFLFSTNVMLSQNTNVKDETKTTTTTFKDSEGEKSSEHRIAKSGTKKH